MRRRSGLLLLRLLDVASRSNTSGESAGRLLLLLLLLPPYPSAPASSTSPSSSIQPHRPSLLPAIVMTATTSQTGTGPSSLPHLPIEIQTQILLHLSSLSPHQATLVSRVSRLYHALSLQTLYSHPLLSSQKAVESLRRSLVETPSLVEHFTSLAVISGNHLPARGAREWENEWVEVVKPGPSLRSSRGKQTWDEVRKLEPAQPAPPRLLLTMGGDTDTGAPGGSHFSLYAPSHFQPRFTTQVVGDRILRLVAPNCKSLLLDRHFFYDLNGGLYAARRAEEICFVGLKDPLDLTGLGSGLEDEANRRAEKRVRREEARWRRNGEAFSGSSEIFEMRKALAYRSALRHLPLRRIEIAHSPSNLLSNLSSLQSLTHIVITYPELPPAPPSPHLMSLRIVPRSAICLLLGLGNDGQPLATTGTAGDTATAAAAANGGVGPGVEADTAAEQEAMSRGGRGPSAAAGPRLQRIVIRANAEVCARIADELRPIEDERLRFRIVGLRRRKREASSAVEREEEQGPSENGNGNGEGDSKRKSTATPTARWEFRRTDFAAAWRRGVEVLEEKERRRGRDKRERRAASREKEEEQAEGRTDSGVVLDEQGGKNVTAGQANDEEEEESGTESEADEDRHHGDEATLEGRTSTLCVGPSSVRKVSSSIARDEPLHSPWADEGDDVLGATAQGAAWLAWKADEERIGWRWIRGEDVGQELEGLGADGEGNGEEGRNGDAQGFGRWWF